MDKRLLEKPDSYKLHKPGRQSVLLSHKADQDELMLSGFTFFRPDGKSLGQTFK